MAYYNRKTQQSRYCSYCRRQVLATQYGPPVAVHVLMTLFTCGLWLPVLLLIMAFATGYRCQTCGKKV